MTTETTASPGTDTAAPKIESTAATTTETTATAPVTATTETKAADAGTLLADSGAGTDKPAAAPATWPADWREQMAGGDKKVAEQLARYGSPADVWTKARSLEQKLSSGEYKRDLPKDATPEQVAEWRKERGIPDSNEGYLENLALPDGVVIGEADKPLVLGFAEAALSGEVTPAQYSKLVAKYYDMQDQIQAQKAEQDRSFQEKAADELRAEWGAEYTPNINAVKNLLAGMPEGAADNLLKGRLLDGTKIGDNPGVVKWLASISRELNPAATLVPANSGSAGVADRLTEIRKFRQENPDKYDADKKLQAEELQLIDAQVKLQARGRAA